MWSRGPFLLPHRVSSWKIMSREGIKRSDYTLDTMLMIAGRGQVRKWSMGNGWDATLIVEWTGHVSHRASEETWKVANANFRAIVYELICDRNTQVYIQLLLVILNRSRPWRQSPRRVCPGQRQYPLQVWSPCENRQHQQRFRHPKAILGNPWVRAPS